MIKTSLVTLGSLKCNIDFQYLSTWPSDILEIKRGGIIAQLPDAKGPNGTYLDEQLLRLFNEDQNADFTVALINAPLQNNYYMRLLSDKIVVMSLYEMADIIRRCNFSIECYVIRNIYELAVIFAGNNGAMLNGYDWVHDDIRGCLFDMNLNKFDIIFSMHKPTLCQECRNRLYGIQLDAHFLLVIEKELCKIKKSLYGRIIEWIKAHPIYALLLAAIYGILLNLIASVMFEIGKWFLD